jgi:hypothetical protein
MMGNNGKGEKRCHHDWIGRAEQDGVSYFYLFMALYAVVDASVVVVAVGEVAFDSSALRVE